MCTTVARQLHQSFCDLERMCRCTWSERLSAKGLGRAFVVAVCLLCVCVMYVLSSGRMNAFLDVYMYARATHGGVLVL